MSNRQQVNRAHQQRHHRELAKLERSNEPIVAVGLNLDPQWALPSMRLPSGELEQGDTGHNVFTIAYCEPTFWHMPTIYQLLIGADGWPRRSPDESKWYGLPGRCSRDLLTPVLCYEAAYGTRFWPLVRTMLSRLMLLSNNYIPNHQQNAHKHKLPDFLGPDIWAIVLRGIMLRVPIVRLLWPLLLVLDLHNLASALLSYKGITKSNDQRNRALKLHISSKLFPTPVSKFAYKLYWLSSPRAAFAAWWQTRGEPRIDLFMNKLYNELPNK